VFTKLTSVTRKFGIYTVLQIMFLRKMWTKMSALPGYINRGCINTLFLSNRKHLNI